MHSNLYTSRSDTRKDGFRSCVFVLNSEANRIAEYVRSNVSIEIGGDLFGFFSPEGFPIVLVATGPGPEAKQGHGHFLQDPDFQTWAFRELATRYRLYYLGDWSLSWH